MIMILSVLFIGCQNGSKKEQEVINNDWEEIDDDSCSEEFHYINSIKGHNEQDTITGNFTGLGIDTLYVASEYIEPDSDDDWHTYRAKYYAKSNNPQLPTIELYGCIYASPLLVYEGDVDGDGKDEWGYIHTWMTSQWRYYRIYNYDNKTRKWRFLYQDETGADPYLLETGLLIRGSGREIVEKGPKPGYIKINYQTVGADEEIRDTIVRATYTPISEDV